MPSNGVEAFQNDYTVSSHQVTKTGPNSDGKDGDKTCVQCPESKPLVSFCSECNGHLCFTCTQAHKKMKDFQSHEIKDEKTLSDSVCCSQHPGKEMEFYCKTCLTVMCSRCFHASHRTHDTTEIDSQTRKEVEGQIKDLVEKAQSKLSVAKEHLAYIETITKDTVTRPIQIQTKIKTVFDSIIASRQKVLLEEAEQSCTQDQKMLWAQSDQVGRNIDDIESALNFAERSQHCSKNDVFLCHGNQIIRGLKELNQTDLDLPSTESFEMTTREFTHGELPNLADFGSVPVTINRPKLEITYFGPVRTTHLHENVQFEVKVVLKIGETQTKSKKRPKLKVGVTHGHAGVSIPSPPHIEECEDKWIVSFNPVVSGAHTLTVSTEINFGKQDIKEEIQDRIKIKGRPEIENRVHRGPDWNSQQDGQDDGNKEGTVIGFETNNLIKVRWNGNDHEGSYKWGEGGKYEVQMAHSD